MNLPLPLSTTLPSPHGLCKPHYTPQSNPSTPVHRAPSLLLLWPCSGSHLSNSSGLLACPSFEPGVLKSVPTSTTSLTKTYPSPASLQSASENLYDTYFATFHVTKYLCQELQGERTSAPHIEAWRVSNFWCSWAGSQPTLKELGVRWEKGASFKKQRFRIPEDRTGSRRAGNLDVTISHPRGRSLAPPTTE